jgi:two-component system sensor histidine kinase KdpD
VSDERPDPDALLAQVQAEEARARRGRLKIFLGACAGVGKTFAMLVAARAAQAQGVPLTVGLVETHGRAETEAMAQGLPRLALRSVARGGSVLRDFDLDAALAFGAEHPGALVLLDELAHSNAGNDAVSEPVHDEAGGPVAAAAGSGSRHPKRWQDVQELLAAGIDVWTTVNIQHLESLNDIVSGITGVRVWETVPDRVFDDADEVVVVDLPPDELLLRLRQGKVYLPRAGDDRAERAAEHFFRKGNLLALRELTLRRTADRVDDEMQAWRRRNSVHAATPVWPNRESLLACVGAGELGEKVVRSCARLAAQLGVSWHAVHVETPSLRRQSEARRAGAFRVLALAQGLGATTAALAGPDLPEALMRYAREHNLARLVLGRRARRWRWPWRPSLAEALLARADELDVLQVALPDRDDRGDSASNAARSLAPPPPSGRWQPYLGALGICGLTAAAATPLLGVLELSNIIMLFLLAVVGVALLLGRGPAVLAAFVGVALFDFFFVPPRFSFAVGDPQYLLTFGVLLVVALVIGQLTAGLKVQAEAAMQREHRVRSLYEMSRDLSAALLPDQVAEIGARFLRAEFGARSALLVADAQDRLQTLAGATAAVDAVASHWAFERGEAAGRGTGTLPANPGLALPLKAPMRTRGVLVVELVDARTLGPEQRRLLETCASLLAISLERIHYIEVAQTSTLQMESERLRNSLLSAISHDLRTPLTALVGLAETLELAPPTPQAAQREIAQAIRHSALRMNALVNNLLDMARLESGAVELNRQWQPLDEVIGSALAVCHALLAGRPLQLSLADDLPLLHLDAVLIESVLVNLLENAAKYTPPGSAIEIAAQADATQVRLTLSDHGPGLPRGREEAIFDKFERGQKESATPGVGLGLAICRAILQAHGGRIRGENRPEGGARFVVELPRGEPPGDDGATSPAAQALAAVR